MKISFILIASFFAFCFYSCTLCSVKKVPCGAFNEPAFFKWFPYKKDDVLIFKNAGKPETFSYSIYRTDTSAAYEATRGGYNNTTRGCSSSAEITTFNDGNLNEYLSMYYSVLKEFDNGLVTKYLSVYFKGQYWPAGEITENNIAAPEGLSTDSMQLSTAANLVFDDGKTYPYVVTMLKDTVVNKTERVYKLFIAKNSGIIGFEMYPSKQRWIIQ